MSQLFANTLVRAAKNLTMIYNASLKALKIIEKSSHFALIIFIVSYLFGPGLSDVLSCGTAQLLTM